MLHDSDPADLGWNADFIQKLLEQVPSSTGEPRLISPLVVALLALAAQSTPAALRGKATGTSAWRELNLDL